MRMRRFSSREVRSSARTYWIQLSRRRRANIEQEAAEERDPAQRFVHGRTTWVISASVEGAGAGAGRRAVSLIRMRMPIRAQLAMTDDAAARRTASSYRSAG
ncbi:hypothetical protein SCALM49S_04504 [Streptomyces californicus]